MADPTDVSTQSNTFYIATIFISIILVLIYSGLAKSLGNFLSKKFIAYFINSFTEKSRSHLKPRKSALFSKLTNDLKTTPGEKFKVVEIGAGAGANFQYYPAGCAVTCIEPNDFFEPYLRKNLSGLGNNIELEGFKVCKGEDMSACVESGSVDVAVCTWVLCSVDDVEKTLKEVIRILKPGGKLVFWEHIQAEEGSLANKIQGYVAPVWWALLKCRCNQRTQSIIDKAGFSKVEYELVNLTEMKKAVPFVMKPISSMVLRHALGIATK